jgi:hypothetical protein
MIASDPRFVARVCGAGSLPSAPNVPLYALKYSTTEVNYMPSLSAATAISTIIGCPVG